MTDTKARRRPEIKLTLDPGQLAALDGLVEDLEVEYRSTAVGAAIVAAVLLRRGDTAGALAALAGAEDAAQGARPRGGGGRWDREQAVPSGPGDEPQAQVTKRVRTRK